MIIGIPKETFPGETRIALIPSEIKLISLDKLLFHVENDAGMGAYFSDDSYRKSGAEVVGNVYSNSNLIIRINPPSEMEIDMLKEGFCLVSLINPFINHNLV